MAVAVKGLRELDAAFKAADKALQRELRTGLKAVAEPVRADAERLAVANITRIGLPWSRMRVGTLARGTYIAPRERGAKGRGNQRLRRPNLAGLLLGQAMEPALERNQGRVVDGVDRLLDTVALAWERA